jgi:hypothetical protein
MRKNYNCICGECDTCSVKKFLTKYEKKEKEFMPCYFCSQPKILKTRFYKETSICLECKEKSNLSVRRNGLMKIQ